MVINVGEPCKLMPNERRLDAKGHILVIPLVGNVQNKAVYRDRRYEWLPGAGAGVYWAQGFLLGLMKMSWDPRAVMVAN